MSSHDTCVKILSLYQFICKITYFITYLNSTLFPLTYQIKRGRQSRLPFPDNAFKNILCLVQNNCSGYSGLDCKNNWQNASQSQSISTIRIHSAGSPRRLQLSPHPE